MRRATRGAGAPPGRQRRCAGAGGVSRLRELVEGSLDYLRLREHERTTRAQVDAYRALASQRIKAAEGILRDYFHQVFAERAHTFDELLSRLDRATDASDGTRVSETLDAIVAIARHPPLADLGDLERICAALGNPDHVWEL